MPEQAKTIEPAKQSTAQAQLKLVRPADLSDRVQHLYDSISRRAFEIFDGHGRTIGHDLEHWLQAESELLHPFHVDIAETEQGLTVRAEVPGFTAKELDISLEPWQLTITGKREAKQERKDGKSIYTERCCNQILRVVNLPSAVDTAKGSATLTNGVLELKVPKATPAKKVQIESKSV